MSKVSLRDYVDIRLNGVQESMRLAHEAEVERGLAYKTQSELVAGAIEIRFANIDKSVMLAADSVDRRLEGMNEFREQLNTQAAGFVTHAEQAPIEKRLQSVENILSNIQGRFWAIGAALTVITIIVNIVLHYVK